VALEEINWDKAMGPDLLHGKGFKDEEGFNMITDAVFQLMNQDIIPDYLKESQLFLLSKNGEDICGLDELRPIVLLCFLAKGMARTLLNRMKKFKYL
jgi:hypothetical protein